MLFKFSSRLGVRKVSLVQGYREREFLAKLSAHLLTMTSSNKAIPLNLQPKNSIADVLDFLSASTNLPSDVRVLLGGRHLQPSETVSALNLKSSATLEVISPLRGGTAPTSSVGAVSDTKPVNAGDITNSTPDTKSTASSNPTDADVNIPSNTSSPFAANTATSTPPTPAVRRKPRCSHPPCKAPVQPITGDCGFCQKRFCGKHRMLESHSCEGLEDAKKAERDRNKDKLENERTVMLRGI